MSLTEMLRNTMRECSPDTNPWQSRKTRSLSSGLASANMNVENDKKFLIKVISQCLPFIGYPRSLNALACVNKAAEKN